MLEKSNAWYSWIRSPRNNHMSWQWMQWMQQFTWSRLSMNPKIFCNTLQSISINTPTQIATNLDEKGKDNFVETNQRCHTTPLQVSDKFQVCEWELQGKECPCQIPCTQGSWVCWLADLNQSLLKGVIRHHLFSIAIHNQLVQTVEMVGWRATGYMRQWKNISVVTIPDHRFEISILDHPQLSS